MSHSQSNMQLEVLTAYGQSHLATLDMHTADDVEQMLTKAHSLFKKRDSWLAKHERIAILKKLASLMSEQVEALAMTIAKEGGKPLKDARVESERAIDGVEKAIEALAHLNGSEIPMGLTPAAVNKLAFSYREPIGVVVAVSAFNHPLNLIIHQVIPAVAVGCPVIVKPASTTPLSCLKVAELLAKAGLPEGWCQVCICDNKVATQLVTDSRLGFFSFIGSARVGWQLRSQLAPGVRCALEHGGVAPVIVDSTADVEAMIPKLAKGGFYHAGQVCVSVQRVFVPKDMAENIANKLAKAAEQLTVGDPTQANTDVGPLILPREVDRIDEWVQEAVQQGATLITGGKKLANGCYAPTVLLDPSEQVKVSTQEVFGPVVCIYGYQTIDEAVQRANSLNVAFQAAVFSNNLQQSMKVMQQLDASAVMLNDHTAFRVDWMPFAGRRHSGLGTGGIGHTMHDMTQEKMFVLNL
ncbi:aldehyde dehydrogenase family protein [Endozoicomonas sp. SM1973]|uniref:Aldehyde dehydrogenase family protein n=1 Tax=Spartinivicinus marinus TaxID=2994442 RepID=A0A853I5T7_9GAMM|nr:aldehyde dehydrogenase family protein [Spartinivicinus marinus]MCX4026169.1 aldehyde dehydrogenase family protein [Spartinivicinus marinus]NYZ68703.1 aldehyde dehydrogenase family protein [Spartinivicinus marinus]